MVRFNIIGTGFVDMAEGSGVAFTTENQQFRFCDISMGRSVQFSIPATAKNRQLLGFGEDPAETGAMLRTVHPCQCVYDGGVVNGTLSVTSYEGEAFKCVFKMGWSEKLDNLQKRKLADCVTSYTSGVAWDGTYTGANNADPSQVIQVLQYENGGGGDAQWGLVPSVCATTYIADILANLGLTFVTDLQDEFWLVSASMNGGGEEAVTFSSTGLTSMAVSPSTYFDVVNIDVEWATANFIGLLVGGGSTPTQGFKAKADTSMNFPNTFPNGVFLIKWNKKLAKCENLGGSYLTGKSPCDPLQGATIQLSKGDIVFFASRAWGFNLTFYGWKASDILTGYSYTVQVVRDNDLSLNETWYLQFNAPDMTVFEYLKSLALATGRELLVDGDTVSVVSSVYGQAGDFKDLRRVVSIDSVERVVECWGGNTKKATIAFDSDDYVDNRILSSYDIDNENKEGETEWKSLFSEGEVGTAGVLVKDVDGHSLTAKKWTICVATSVSPYLQRIEMPNPAGYFDIADNSTCLKAKAAVPEAEFFGLERSTVFVWRGCAYVWTDAQWSDDIMTLTLQRVSQPDFAAVNAKKHLTLTAGSGGASIRLDKQGSDSGTLDAVLEYSTDGGFTWLPYNWNGDTGDTITLAEGENVKFKGNNAAFSKSGNAFYQFVILGYIKASGDVTSLLNEIGGDVTLPNRTFDRLFKGCSSLLSAPSLPSLAIGEYAYQSMFYGCTGITTMIDLPANTLALGCYTQMFYGCTGLTFASLPAETLVERCYQFMFDHCSNLAEVDMYATDISATNCLSNWLNSVAAVGLLRCDSSLILPIGASGLPTGWTRVNL